MAVIQGHVVDRIKRAGIADKGQAVYIEYILEGDDRDTATVIWPHHKLAKTVTRLMHIAGKAASLRAALSPRAGPSGDSDISSPLQMTKLAVGTAMGNKNIFLHLETKENFAMDMAMNADLATKLVSRLQYALEELPQTSQRKLH